MLCPEKTVLIASEGPNTAAASGFQLVVPFINAITI